MSYPPVGIMEQSFKCPSSCAVVMLTTVERMVTQYGENLSYRDNNQWLNPASPLCMLSELGAINFMPDLDISYAKLRHLPKQT